ncbi:3-oxoacyl-[acyl-carrier-protein] reductase [Caloramator quimbayensis]|uniref:3-oxoacyl-[acyl-carrier-protein] reductase n=1 Tax=Caloramator quimbayensis TaxID=1147123 RepID=A0A1T4XRQ5_9CLOT|nr:3-oxoacyl-[acyl-carrier-protein] reductase [Caloramator quimbayensis]SKA92240.1 3-oxoacyl-[acyl-carrier-protein] reductase [Caloramator quimbayensis]
MKLKGKVALITGASSGIGRAIALKFALEGAIVIVNYSGNAESAQKVVEEINSSGGICESIKCDVSNYDDVKNMIDNIIEKYNSIDILVNNAGITKDNLIMRMDVEDFDRVIDVNLKGCFNTIKCASRYMIKQKHGKIINMSSVIGITGNAGQANYAASKAGVIALTKSAAKEFASRNINVNAIAPGYIETRMTEVLNEKIKEDIIDKIPLKKAGNPEDVAKTALFLACDESNYITGQVINVDGGMVM